MSHSCCKCPWCCDCGVKRWPRFEDWIPRLEAALWLLLADYYDRTHGQLVGDGQEWLAEQGWAIPQWLTERKESAK